MKRPIVVPTVYLAVAATVTLAVPSAPNFPDPDLARLIIVHLPCAFTTTFLILFSAFYGWKYLRTRDLVWDARNAAAIELGALFGTLTMATGILFSKVQWGAWWQWDVRQTSFLMVLLIFAAGLALRGAFGDERRRAVSSAGYSIVAFVPAVLLIFVLPRIPLFQSFHPVKAQFDRFYWLGILVTGIATAWLCIVAFKTRMRAGILELGLEEKNADVAVGGPGSGVVGVVRPVSVPAGSSRED